MARDALVESSGGISRRLHEYGLLPGLASGGVRFLSGKLAASGRYRYRNQFGHVLDADLADYMERIGFFGAHSPTLIRYVTSWLRPGDWAIDAGANVGLLTSPMCAAVGASGSVWAVEPLPANVERLHVLKDDNKLDQLKVFPVALSASESTGRLRLSSRPGGSGAASFVAPWGKEEFVEVTTTPLDQLTERSPKTGPLRLIKLDVEGFEVEVLAGAAATLATWRPMIICEFHDPLLRAAGSSAEQLLAAFDAHGYSPSAPFGRPKGSLDGKVCDMLLAHREGLPS